MKPQAGGPAVPGENRPGSARRGVPSRRSGLSPLPVEWMDPMSWRLPSGKALAEFALQAGFLAPLLMSGSMGTGRVKRVQKKSGEAPVSSGTFRAGGESTGVGQE